MFRSAPAGHLDLVALQAAIELKPGETLRDRGIYTIARVVVFKDDVLARHRPDWALLDGRTQRPWRDNEGLAWVDPFRDEAWDYAIAVAREAAFKGFQEIQFDYGAFRRMERSGPSGTRG